MKKSKLSTDPNQGMLLTQEDLRGPGGFAALVPLRREANTCTKCELHKARTCVVFGKGNSEEPRIAFVGEGPGAHEDKTGEPFVGVSGHMLTRMVTALGLRREDLFILNVVMCRPPDNRPPTAVEIGACQPFLYGQIRAVRPRVIVCLGRTAASAFLPTMKPMDILRLDWHEWEGIPLRVTYHPSFLCRPEGETYKSHAWVDLQEVAKKLGLPLPASRTSTA